MIEAKSITLAIVGCRDYDDYASFCERVDKYIKKIGLPIKCIFSGEAPGVDDMAEDYAIDRGYKFEGIPADWDTHGKAAGFIRNAEIVKAVSHVLAFWDKTSSGTKDTIDRALKARKVLTILPIVKTAKRYYCRRKLAQFAAEKQTDTGRGHTKTTVHTDGSGYITKEA